MCKSSASLGLRLILFLGKAQILSTFSVSLAIGLQGIPLSCESKILQAPGYGTFHPKKPPSPGHQISGLPLPTGTPSLHVSQPPSGGNPLRYLSPSTKTGPKSCWKQRWWAFSSWVFWIFSFFWFTPPFFGLLLVSQKTYPAPQLGPWQLISWNGPSRPISVAVGLMITMIF